MGAMKKCNCDTCPLCKKAVDERHTTIAHWGVIIVVAFTVLLLAFSLGSCGRKPEKAVYAKKLEKARKKQTKLIERFPELVDTTTRVDSILISDTTKKNRKELTRAELDSILQDYCNDTVESIVYRDRIKDRIKDRIIDRCNLPRKETVLLDNGTIFITRDSGGTEYELKTVKEIVHKDRIVYLDKTERLKWFGMGFLGMLFLILLIVALVKWGFR